MNEQEDTQEWMSWARCQGMDPDIFFPEVHDDVSTRLARATCSACPVKPQCLGYGVSLGAKYGVWGGHSPRELRPLRRRYLAEQRKARKL